MKRLIVFGMFLLLSLQTWALEGESVRYLGGTAVDVNAGTIGTLDTTSETSLIFVHTGGNVMIPYASIESFDDTTELTHHLGVMPAVAVGLMRVRKHRHFFRISYRGADGVAQVAVFEVPKAMPRSLNAVLTSRSPVKTKACDPCAPQK